MTQFRPGVPVYNPWASELEVFLRSYEEGQTALATEEELREAGFLPRTR